MQILIFNAYSLLNAVIFKKHMTKGITQFVDLLAKQPHFKSKSDAVLSRDDDQI